MTDKLLRLAQEVDDLGLRLSMVGTELRSLQEPHPVAPATPTPAERGTPHQVSPTDGSAPPDSPTNQAGPGQQHPLPHNQPTQPHDHTANPRPTPFHHGRPAMVLLDQSGQPNPALPPYDWSPVGPPGGPESPPPRHTLGEWLSKEGAGSKLLAWVGGAVTLLGVVLLLILAVQRGWLGPLPRVLLGAAFGVGLVVTGLRVHRKPGARTGAFALAATGIAVLYLDTIAATALYQFLPAFAGLAVGLAIAGSGLTLATRWDSELLATAVILGCAGCAPIITSGFTPTVVAFLLIISLAPTRDWPIATPAARIPPAVASVLSSITIAEPGSWANTTAALATGVVAVTLALLTLRRTPDDVSALVSLGVAVVPTLAAAAFLPTTQAVAITAAAAIALLSVWALRRQPVAGAAGMVAAVQATATFFDGSAMTSVLFAEGLLLTVVAWRTNDRTALYGGMSFAVLGTLRALPNDIPPGLLAEFGYRPEPGALLVAALLLAVAIAVPWAAHRAGLLPAPSTNLAPWLVAGGAALYGAAALVLTAALLALPDREGFLTGHVLVTVSWTAAALVLLAKGIHSVPLRVSGLVLVAAAVGKLVLFDLAALDGIARVAVFIAAGLILLTAGTRYARMVSAP